jgi:hypothetical protein
MRHSALGVNPRMRTIRVVAVALDRHVRRGFSLRDAIADTRRIQITKNTPITDHDSAACAGTSTAMSASIPLVCVPIALDANSNVIMKPMEAAPSKIIDRSPTDAVHLPSLFLATNAPILNRKRQATTIMNTTKPIGPVSMSILPIDLSQGQLDEADSIARRTSKISHTCAWRGLCVSTERDKHTCWL